MKYFTTSKLSENIHETPEGYLVCVGVPIARTGAMQYGKNETPLEVGEDGIVTIDRAENEVFRPETIASFEGKPITITHPIDFVAPENWKELAKGTIQNVRRGEGDQATDLIADLLITDSVAIGLVRNGLREVSCGYEAEYTQTGEGRGVQTNIIGNHLALVDEGRAGAAYAINDHKGKGLTMKFGEKIKAIFAKAQDEAMKVADEAASGEKKDDKPAKDAAGGVTTEVKATDEMAGAYDEMKKMMDAMGAAMEKFKPKDASTPPTQASAAEVVAKDEPVDNGLESRLKAVEAALAKLLEGKAAAGDEESDEITDADEDDESDESKDAGMPEMTGDTRSRIEILAPGLKLTKGEKTPKAKALTAAYATTDGKRVIDTLTSGKAPAFDSDEKATIVFLAASELLKRERSSALSKTKTRDFNAVVDHNDPGFMTAEKMNEIHAKHYAQKG